MAATILDKYRTESYEYENREHQLAFLQNLYKYKSSNEFSDVTVNVDGTEFYCHKIILASSSPYFKALFLHQTDARVTSQLFLKDLPATGFESLLHYIYSGKLELRSSNLIETLEVADFLQFRNLVEVCCSLLLQHITIYNCLRIAHVADQHSCHGLHRDAHQFCLSHFSDVVMTDDFLELFLNDLVAYLENDHLSLENEIDLVEGISRWCYHDIADRAHQLDHLLTKYVRLNEIKNANLELLLDEDSFLKNCSILQSCVKQTNSKDNLKAIAEPCPLMLQPRLKEVVVVIKKHCHASEHGYSTPKKNPQKIIYYHPESRQWYQLTSLPFDDKDMYSAAVLHNDIYITGGEIDGEAAGVTADVWVYSVQDDRWTEAEPLLNPRRNHSSAVLMDKLYVVGGKGIDSRHLRRDGEVYDPLTKQWTMLPNLIDIDGLGHASLVPLNEKLYIIGGMCSYMNEPTKEVSWKQYLGGQCYDPVKGSWERLAALSQAIVERGLKPCGDECLPYLGFILFVDEDPYQKSKQSKTLKLYNPVTECLDDFVAIKPVGRFGGYTMFRDEIVKTGGVRDRFTALNLVHSCDLNQDCPDWVMWTQMPKNSSHHACLTIFKELPTTPQEHAGDYEDLQDI